MKVSIYLGFALLLFHLMEMFPEQTILKDAMSSFSSGYVVYDGVATTAIDEFLNESSLVERMSPLHDHTVTWDSDIATTLAGSFERQILRLCWCSPTSRGIIRTKHTAFSNIAVFDQLNFTRVS
jgi:hypothetical protein